MANYQPPEGLGDEYFEQIMSVSGYNSSGGDHQSGWYVGSGSGGDHGPSSILLGLDPGDESGHGVGLGGSRGAMGLGFNLDHYSSFSGLGDGVNVASSSARLNENESLHLTNLFPAFSQLQSHPIRAPPPSIHVPQGHWAPRPAQTMSHPPAIRPRVRARRGQATDPHSIAERLRRERIAERMKALQVLVPSCNKSDRAAMLDEIADYFKFLRLQVKVLSMCRLGGAGAVSQLVANVPPTSIEGDGVEGAEPVWDKWSNDGTEQQVARLMEQDIGAAMQFLQSKELCIMPVSLASAIFRSQPPPPDPALMVIPETNNSPP